jgi:hypothetical protein
MELLSYRAQIAPGGGFQMLPAGALGSLVAFDSSGEITLVHRGGPQRMRRHILRLKDQLLALPETEKREMHVEHVFVDGMYARKLHIRAGTLLVGKVHRKACLNFVERGDIAVLTEHGSTRVKAGAMAASPAGTIKVGYAYEDTVFVNVFRTDETDVERIENEIACESHDLIETRGELPCQ